MKKSLLFILTFLPYFCLADCNQSNHCNRNCWDPNGTHPAQTSPSTTNVTHIIVHHTGDGIVFPSNTDYAEKVRFYWDLHVNTNGWSDIGYNWLIDKNGVVYEGRGDGIVGAHFSSMNSGTMGVALIGDFTLETPSSSAINSLESLIAWEATDKNIDVTTSSFHSSSNLTLNNVSGHLDGGSGTVCPGSDLYSLLPSIRTNVSDLSCYNGSSTNNDNCNDAITLQSNQNCNYISGTVNNATSDNSWNDATCDLFSGSSLAADVFYKFTATSNTHIVTINPTGDLDAVVGLYQGGSCNNLNEVECEDTPGGNGTTTIMNANNLNIGTTYWIRIYDYGSQPPSNGDFDVCITHSNSGGSEDVTVANATASPTSVNAGEDIDVSADQNYSGSQTVDDLPNIDLDYYLSVDCNLSSDDILLGTDSSTIGSDDTSDTESDTITIPSDTANGTYYIIFSADNENEVNESNESNNIGCIQIIVGNSGGSEDVTVANATASPTSVNAGEDIDVSVDQNYSGSQTVDDLPNIDLDYYFSIDCNLSSDDILLGTDSSTIGNDDTSDTESDTITIPSDTANGTYYIIFSADNEDEINESNESNNIACVQITVEGALSVIDYDFQNQLKVYPNPTSNFVNIRSSMNLVINKLYVYDLNGRLVKTINGNNINKINIQELTNGIYLLQIISKDNIKAVFRILKK